MTFDDGSGSAEIFTHEDLRARFRAALQIEQMSWAEVCRVAGVDPKFAARAVQEGTYGLQRNEHTLLRLAIALGRDLNWLLTGELPASTPFKRKLEETVRRLAWEYIYKLEVPRREWETVLEAVLNRVRGLQCQTPQAAYRRGVPQTWLDIAAIHDAAKRRNCGEKGTQ